MTPEEVRNSVVASYDAAMAQPNVFQQSGSNVQNLLYGVRLFGREAGQDFIQSNIEEFVRHALEAAECKQSSLTFMVSGYGQAAIDGIAEALRERTLLVVQSSQSTVTLSWARVPRTGET